jgi:hypothetical protein
MSSTRTTLKHRTTECCWTCTLRRKKCDGQKPACLACKSRSITCHGFGDRPGWMNSESLKRAELKSIKDAVKQNSKRRRTEADRVRDDDGLADPEESRPVHNRAIEAHEQQLVRAGSPSEIAEHHFELPEAHYSPPTFADASSRAPSIVPTPTATTSGSGSIVKPSC